MNSLLTRLYPFLFLALVVCGPVLLLPHTLPVFTFVATVDAIGTLVFGAVTVVCYVLHVVVPDEMRKQFAAIAAKIVGQSRLSKITTFFNRAFNLSTALLLILTAHPWFGGLAVLKHFIVTAYLRLMAKIYAANKPV